MSLLDEAQEYKSRIGGTCGVERLAKRLDRLEQDELDEALASDVDAGALSRALSARGHDLPAQTIRRHRRRDCTCP